MKRKTKAQREAAEYAALLQRIRDIYSGACGCAWNSDYRFAVADELSRILPTIREVFGLVREILEQIELIREARQAAVAEAADLRARLDTAMEGSDMMQAAIESACHKLGATSVGNSELLVVMADEISAEVERLRAGLEGFPAWRIIQRKERVIQDFKKEVKRLRAHLDHLTRRRCCVKEPPTGGFGQTVILRKEGDHERRPFTGFYTVGWTVIQNPAIRIGPGWTWTPIPGVES